MTTNAKPFATCQMVDEDDETEANARLIAAAPELLEFVLAFRDVNYEEDGWIDLKSFAKTASALIAKAEGK